ncbi:conserved hypothetical protein [Echinococcus multilocularis]|uniref:Uncharacterized protein n=1 Tax=Echinococcus multilocularis TaxID=6211 RepID=A0A068YCZ5_ECHMU|nr:conserved hypothetical protein [Echinococcus multilocularis]
MAHMDRISISRLFDPRNLGHFRTDDLEAILILNGFYPSREDIEQAREKYGDLVSKEQVEDELCKQRKKPPIEMKNLFDEVRDILNVQRGCFSREDLIALFAEQKRPLKEQDVDTLLNGICDKGVVKLRSFLDRLARPVNTNK